MSPEVLARKLERLATFLADLRTHRGRTRSDIHDDPYAVERLLELLVQVAVDIVAHLLAEKGVTASSYRGAFEAGGQAGLLPVDLAARLSDAAGLRNVLVHLYEDIDYQIVADSVEPALTDFEEFLGVMERRLRELDADTENGPRG